MHCRGCGTQLANPQHFCPRCGTTLAVKAESPETVTLGAGDVTGPGRVLHARFVSLGNMTGKTNDEIMAVVGRPSSMSSMAGGKMLLQWQATGCHMALLFDASGRFVEITHQYSHYAPAPTIISVDRILLGVVAGLVVLGILVVLVAVLLHG
jgi:hypothetical protein